ncbi:hypothetical protein PSAB6_610018 [Paraburkholderia sabiae]|nr:hypothetical protein PSAB6_610018 [Paraburkholderia sabiae]
MANGVTAKPGGAVGCEPDGRASRGATWTVGTSEVSGAGNVGDGPKLASSGAVDGVAHAASGMTRIAVRVGWTRMGPPAWIQLVSSKRPAQRFIRLTRRYLSTEIVERLVDKLGVAGVSL